MRIDKSSADAVLSFQSSPWKIYQIDAGTNLGGWRAWQTNILGDGSKKTFLATNALLQSGGFYRLVHQAPAVSNLAVSGFPSPQIAGAAGSFSVTALDSLGQPATIYTGTVQFASSDPLGVLPANHAFQPADAGTHSFSATLRTVGTQTITATDTAAPDLRGSLAVPVLCGSNALSGGIQRVGATATLLPDGKVLVAGGGSRSSNGGLRLVAGLSRSVEIYDPATGTSSVLGGGSPAPNQRMTTERGGHAAVLAGTKVYFFGGAGTTNDYTNRIIDVFDTATKTFLTNGQPTLQTGRTWHTATLLGVSSGGNAGKIVLAGGCDANGTPLNSMELFTPGGGTTPYAATLLGAGAGSGRAAHTATLVDKWLCFAGGFYGTGVSSGVSSSVDAIDTTLPAGGAGAATVVNSGPPANARSRYGHAAILCGGNRILLAGGIDPSGNLLSSVQTYLINPANGVATNATIPAYMTVARANFPLLQVGPGDLFIAFGGTSYIGSTDVGSTAVEYLNATIPAAISISMASSSLKVPRQLLTAVKLELPGASRAAFFVAGGDPGSFVATSGTAEIFLGP